MEKLATAWPPDVKRVSGSRPSRPTRMTLLTDILLSPYVEQDNMKAKKNEMLPSQAGRYGGQKFENIRGYLRGCNRRRKRSPRGGGGDRHAQILQLGAGA